MYQTACFAPSPVLNLRLTKLRRSGVRIVHCTLTPDRKSVPKPPNKKSKKHVYRVLPDDLPESERPPPPPNHFSVPIIGFYLEKLLRIDTKNYEKRDKYGPIYTSSFLIGPRTYITDHSAVIDILKDAEVFPAGGAFEAFTEMLGSDSLSVTDGEEHDRIRANIAPAFAPAIFPYYFECIQKRVVSKWEEVLKKATVKDTFKMTSVFPDCYIAIMVELTTGIDMSGDTRIKKLCVDILLSFFSPRFGPLWEGGKRARDELLKRIEDVVYKDLAERADTIEELRQLGVDMRNWGSAMRKNSIEKVDILLVAIANSPLSTEPGAAIDEEIVAALCRSMMILWFAGYSTAATVSACVALEMGLDDKLRSRLIAEQDAIVESAEGNTEVTYKQVMSEMSLLDSFITEMLRLHPPVAEMARRAAKDVEIFGHLIPKGAIVACDLLSANRDPVLFPDPHTIVADRFMMKEGKPKPTPMLTFGIPGSSHYCIGALLAKLFMKTTFATLLRDYTFTLKPGQRTDYRVVPEPVPASGVIVDSFHRRKEKLQ